MKEDKIGYREQDLIRQIRHAGGVHVEYPNDREDAARGGRWMFMNGGEIGAIKTLERLIRMKVLVGSGDGLLPDRSQTFKLANY